MPAGARQQAECHEIWWQGCSLSPSPCSASWEPWSWPSKLRLVSTPGMMPRTTALLLAALGALLVVNTLLARTDALERGSLRGLVFILGAALLFAWLIRPLGLVVAGPVAIVFSSFADSDSRLREIVPFAIVMTGLSIVLFSFGLNLPIPVWPTATPDIPYLPTVRF